MWLSPAYLQLRPLAALALGDPSILALDHLRNAWSPCPLSLPFTFAPWLRHRKVGLVESIHEIQQSQQVWPLVLMIHQSLTSLKDDILHHLTSSYIILHHITSYIMYHIPYIIPLVEHRTLTAAGTTRRSLSASGQHRCRGAGHSAGGRGHEMRQWTL